MMVDDVSRFWEIKSVWETRWDRWGSVEKLWLKLTTSQERQSRRQLPNPRRARSTRQDSHGFDVNFTNGEGEMNKFVSRPSQPLSPQFWKIWRADTLQITSRCQAKSLSTNRAQRGRAIGSWGQNHNQLYAIALAEGSVSKKCFWWTDKIAEAWIHVTSWCWWPASFSYAVYIYVFCQSRDVPSTRAATRVLNYMPCLPRTQHVKRSFIKATPFGSVGEVLFMYFFLPFLYSTHPWFVGVGRVGGESDPWDVNHDVTFIIETWPFLIKYQSRGQICMRTSCCAGGTSSIGWRGRSRGHGK